jgi:hypothetical protein
VSWGKSEKAAFIANLGQVLDQPTILQIAERMVKVSSKKHGYRKPWHDRLFLLKTIGESSVEALRTMEQATSDPTLVAYGFVTAMTETVEVLLAMPPDPHDEDAIERAVLGAKIGVAGLAAADPSYLAGRSVEAAVQALMDAAMREVMRRAAKHLQRQISDE